MFDPSAPHIIILLVVVLLLFGSTRLPGAAQALGKSMHIFRRSVKGLDDDKPGDGNSATHASVVQSTPGELPSSQAEHSQQAQIDALQRQLNDLQRQSPAREGQGTGSTAAEQHDTRSY